MEHKVIEQVELMSSTPALSNEQIEVLLLQGGIAVAVNLSLACVLLALAKLVVACKKVTS